jgi:hypothetical protein
MVGGAVNLMTGDYHTCYLDQAGHLGCAGKFAGDNGLRAEPIVTGVVVQAEIGARHGCLVTSTGGAMCWGTGNAYGELGDGTKATSSQWEAKDVVGLTSGVAAVAVTDFSSCALKTDGHVKCWGQGLPSGDYDAGSAVPVDVPGL